MNYKVGDKILIKTWNEMVGEFGLDCTKDIDLSKIYCWPKSCERNLPQDRIITITNICEDEGIDYEEGWVYKEMIKCHANEYYLQEIKEELCQK